MGIKFLIIRTIRRVLIHPQYTLKPQCAMFVEKLGAVIPWPDLDIWGQKDYNAIIYSIDGGNLCN